jgi:hypothetical protein
MASKTLTVLLVLFSLYALAKFGFFFVLSYERRRAALEKSYQGKSSATAVADLVLLIVAIALVVLLKMRGAEPVSFLTGLLVGMTLIQLYFHQFSTPLTPEEAPGSPVSPIKMISFAIQAKPGRAWKELITIALLLVWSLYGIVQWWRG